jgi:uncharacterized iron-regulated membrane protein
VSFSAFDSSPSKLESTVISYQTPLTLTEILKLADAALPGAITTKIKLPEKLNESVKVHKKFPQEAGQMGHSRVAIDPYSGAILEVKNGLKLAPYQRVLNVFEAIHYGTFAGLPTQILYVLVGITPLILFITSLVMYYYRRPKNKHPKNKTVSQCSNVVS